MTGVAFFDFLHGQTGVAPNRIELQSILACPRRRSRRPAAYAIGMWDVLTWHNGTLAIAWWAVIVLIVALLSIGGTAAARRR